MTIQEELKNYSDETLKTELENRDWYVYSEDMNKSDISSFSDYKLEIELQDRGYWVYEEEQVGTHISDFDDYELKTELQDRDIFFYDDDMLTQDALAWIISKLGDYKLGSTEDMIIRQLRDMYHVGK